MAGATARRKVSSPDTLKNVPGGQTNWKAGVPAFGWYKVADQWWRDLPRLQRGLYQRMLIDYAWGCTVPREEGVPIPEWSPWLSWSDMAARFRCSADQLRDDARDAAKRGMIAVEEAEVKQIDGAGNSLRGKARFQILWQKWPNLKDYIPPKPQLVEKKQPKISSHWFGKDRDLDPGESWKYSVTDLPADFQLQGFVFKNTGESGRVTIAGGGPAEDGLIVLETKARVFDPVESKTSANEAAKKQESTPQTPPHKRESTPQSPPAAAAKSSGKIAFTSPLAKTLAGFGILSDLSVNKLVADCQAMAPECSLEEIEQAVRAIGESAAANPKSRNVGAIVLTQVPYCFKTGSYVAPAVRKEAKTERDRIADEVWAPRSRKHA